VSARFKVSGLTIGQDEVDIMRQTTVLVFEVLERAWATRDCALIDMKIEFGVDSKGTLLLSESEVNDVVVFILCGKYILYSWC
jgi:phosphoribosylaminoimidazole carboxylase/phosphoribosylaminoimidazole-succinocarboxamide synthase